MKENFIVFITKKILEVFLSVSCLVTLTFGLLRFLPGGPFDEDVSLHPLVREQLEKAWHLKDNLVSQYLHYINSLLHGDLGYSMVRDLRVSQILNQGLGETLSLNAAAIFFIYWGAFGLAFVWALFRDRRLGFFLEQIMLALISVPSLFIAPLLIFIFGFYFNILPVAFLESPKHFILPLIALSLRPLASLARLLQKSISEQVSSEYVRAARAKGLNESHILLRHIFRNSLIPVLSYSGPLIMSLFSGSFLIEMLFAIPGLGSSFITGLNERDYTLICGLTLFYGTMLILINLFLDFLMRLVDPRLKDPA